MAKITDRIMDVRERRRTDQDPSSEGNRPEYVVLGGDHLATSIARRLDADGHTVSIVAETNHPPEIAGLRGDPGNVPVLEEAGVSAASTVIVATSRDSRNLLIAQLVRAHFDVANTLVLVNTPDRYDVVSEAGHEPVCATTALSDTVIEGLARLDRGREQTS